MPFQTVTLTRHLDGTPLIYVLPLSRALFDVDDSSRKGEGALRPSIKTGLTTRSSSSRVISFPYVRSF
ncbi:hypothetical protein M408DRAFT_327132 [Serendipita vermifera MAFF 305830]|uniref:Uncharacterized protein n=1 Tax=Serendipita vermifera MAFF 305830 TaxID=933852 RepID=A0A0C2XRY0_SERVB|nr:hypothetical protein M408DRAFT_327132 [Serendipita vermifera MAFF 305830]